MPDITPQYSDAQLLTLYRSTANNRWLGMLFERYLLLVFGVCMKYLRNENDAEDAAQQVFEKVLSEIPKYEIPYFKSWLYSVAKNHCLMQLRSKRLWNKTSDEIPETTATDELSNKQIEWDAYEKEKELDLLLASVHELNNEQAICIGLFYLKKRSYKDIEAATGFSFKEIKSHIQNGKRNLRIILEKKTGSHGQKR